MYNALGFAKCVILKFLQQIKLICEMIIDKNCSVLIFINLKIFQYFKCKKKPNIYTVAIYF